jgi:hypothetical protein
MARPSRHFYRCGDCLSVVAVDAPRAQELACTCGGKYSHLGRVSPWGSLIQTQQRCACDARCTHATGPNCDCQCGGENHGTGRLIEVITSEAGVPTVTPPDAKALERAAEVREAVRKAREALHRKYGELFRAKADGHYIANWNAYLEGVALRQEIARVARLKVHKTRLKRLAELEQQLRT